MDLPPLRAQTPVFWALAPFLPAPQIQVSSGCTSPHTAGLPVPSLLGSSPLNTPDIASGPLPSKSEPRWPPLMPCHNMVALDPAEQLHVRDLSALGTLISMAQIGRMAAWATSTLGRLRSGPRAPDPTLPRAPGPRASPRPSRWVLLLRLPGVGPVGRQQFSPCSLPLG